MPRNAPYMLFVHYSIEQRATEMLGGSATLYPGPKKKIIRRVHREPKQETLRPGTRWGQSGTWTALRGRGGAQADRGTRGCGGRDRAGAAADRAAPGTVRGNRRAGGWGLRCAGSGAASPRPGPARLTCDAGPGDALHHGFHGCGWGKWGGAALLPTSRLCERLCGQRPLRVAPGSAPGGLVGPGWRWPADVDHAHHRSGPPMSVTPT